MRAYRLTRLAAVAAALTAVPTLLAQDSAQAAHAGAHAQPDQPASVCGNTPYCTETNDFAAAITNFRTSDSRGYKIIDVVMHFQNKTPKPLVLAYLQNSGTIIDDKGNRYVVWGPNGVHGIGQVYGGSFDPRFTLGPSGNGDAQFELAWYPGQQIYGFSFSFDLTIDEINSYQGNQHSLGGEFPLHFQGLANGISNGGQVAMAEGALAAASGAGAAGGGGGAAGAGGAAGGQPCTSGGAAGTAAAVAGATGSEAVQGATQQGANAVATAANAVQSVASLFSKKKNPPAKPANSPCGSAASQTQAGASAGHGAGNGASSAAANAPKTAAPSGATTAAKVMTPPTGKTTTPPPKTTTPTTAPVAPHTVSHTGPKKTVTPDTTKRP